ncbi:MAG: hypothetical protein V3U88_06250 [Methylococcales bacterium]
MDTPMDIQKVTTMVIQNAMATVTMVIPGIMNIKNTEIIVIIHLDLIEAIAPITLPVVIVNTAARIP